MIAAVCLNSLVDSRMLIQPGLLTETMPGWWNQDDASRPARRMGEVPPDHDYLPHFRSIRQVRLGINRKCCSYRSDQ